jgi:hypothetical protein
MDGTTAEDKPLWEGGNIPYDGYAGGFEGSLPGQIDVPGYQAPYETGGITGDGTSATQTSDFLKMPTGSQVYGRDADMQDPYDVFAYHVGQGAFQPGQSKDANIDYYNSTIKPMFDAYGMQSNMVDNNYGDTFQVMDPRTGQLRTIDFLSGTGTWWGEEGGVPGQGGSPTTQQSIGGFTPQPSSGFDMSSFLNQNSTPAPGPSTPALGGASNAGNQGDIMSLLMNLAGGGGNFNQSIVDRRVDAARDDLNAQRNSRLSTNQALLADRGLIGDGAEGSSQARLEGDLYDQFQGAVNDIYANESENADSRMVQALSLATGMSLEQASQEIERFRANTDRDLGFGNLALGNKQADNSYSLGLGNLALGNKEADNSFSLGQGNLALGNMRAVNDYNLGLADYGLGRDRLGFDMSRSDDDTYLRLLQLYLQGAGVSADGFI